MVDRTPKTPSSSRSLNDPLTSQTDAAHQSMPPRTDAEMEPATPFTPGGSASPSSDEGRPERSMGDKIASKVEEAIVDNQDSAGHVTADVQEKAGRLAGDVQDKARHVTDEAHSMSDKGIDSTAAGLGQAASMLRQQGEEREGTVGTAAAKTAETLESASTYLQDKDTDQLVSELEALVRKRPVESVLVAAGIGFVLSKVFN